MARIKPLPSSWRKRLPMLFWTGATVGAIALLTGLLYTWAFFSVDSSAVARALIWRDADTGDQFRFPHRTIAAGASQALPLGQKPDFFARSGAAPGVSGEFKDFLGSTGTTAFLVIHRGQLVYEHYGDKVQPTARQTSFSVAKSFASVLVGIAISEGKIKQLDEPITTYIPELTQRDKRFQQITIRHLLTMRSGLKYEESDGPWPGGDDTLTYYGADLRDLALNHAVIETAPGTVWQYNNYNPLLIGIILERATGTSVSEYMSQKLWQPLGAEQDASWSLDSKTSGFEKMESGLNITPRDYARFGLMMLDTGKVGERQIVPEDWVRQSTSGSANGGAYGLFWWMDTQASGRYFAAGNLGQYLYIAPDKQIVIVRTATQDSASYERWHSILRGIADQF